MKFSAALTQAAVAIANLVEIVYKPVAIDNADWIRRAEARAGKPIPTSVDWKPGFEQLMDSLRNEAQLSFVGRISAREQVVSLLEQLAGFEGAPEASGQLARPVFILGLPRTGSTILHNLISQDDNVRCPASWEVMYPGPTNAQKGSERKRTASRLGWANRLAPDFESIHAIGADLPQECIAIQAQAFESILFHTTYRVPSYQAWLKQRGYSNGYKFQRALMEKLSANEASKRWVLKAPGHLMSLKDLLDEFPDAVIVQTHRHPKAVVGSIASHGNVLRKAFSRRADKNEIATDWMSLWADALDKTLAVRDQRGANVLDVFYPEVGADPIAVVKQIYAHAGMLLSPSSEAKMRTFLAKNRKGSKGFHCYSLEDFGLTEAQVDNRFSFYINRFGL
jgi:hypothetical protein